MPIESILNALESYGIDTDKYYDDIAFYAFNGFNAIEILTFICGYKTI